MFTSPYHRPSFQWSRAPVHRQDCRCDHCYHRHYYDVNDDVVPTYKIAFDTQKQTRTVKNCDTLLNDIGQICVDQLQSSVTKDDHVDAFKRILNLLGVKYQKDEPASKDDEWSKQLAQEFIQKLFGVQLPQEAPTDDKKLVKDDEWSKRLTEQLVRKVFSLDDKETKEQPKEEVVVEEKKEEKKEDIKVSVKTVTSEDVTKLITDTINTMLPPTGANGDLGKTVNQLCQLFLTPTKPVAKKPDEQPATTKQADTVLDEFLSTTN